MGPVRGAKRRRRAEKKFEPSAAMPMASSQEAGDWWDGFSRRLAGPLSVSKDTHTFESLFKMSRRTFNYICSLLSEDLMAKTSNFSFCDGKVLSVEDQVAVALRRLTSGGSLVNVGSCFGMKHSTVSQATWRFIEAMEERGIHHLRWPSSEEMESIKSKFEKIYGLPNCCGAIDTTHFMMRLSSAEPNSKVWLDGEKNHSMVLQVIVDPDMRFRDMVTGWPGSMNQSLILRSSGFYKLCETGARMNAQILKISKESGIREYIVGDAGYPLLPWLLTPYQGKDLPESKSEFNRRHSATRMVASRALARFKETWKFFQGEMWRPDKHRLPRIVFVCCLLHNIIIDLEDDVREEMPLSCRHDQSYRQQFCEMADANGVALRDTLSECLKDLVVPL